MSDDRKLSGGLMRLAPLGSFIGVGAIAVTNSWSLISLLCGAGIVVTARRLLKKRGEDPRREIRARAQANARELGQVAREDRIAAPQMKRLAALQTGLLESWDLLPGEYAPVLREDLVTVLDEVERSALLARRRAALRRHLESVDRRAISRRIKKLEEELAALEEGSSLRAPFETALAGRRGELASYDGILDGIGTINAQLEGAESLLGNLRGELLSVDAGPPSSAESTRSLARLREQVSYFRRSLDEVTRSVEGLPVESGGETRKIPESLETR